MVRVMERLAFALQPVKEYTLESLAKHVQERDGAVRGRYVVWLRWLDTGDDEGPRELVDNLACDRHLVEENANSLLRWTSMRLPA
eukprot:6247455-Amphidinium_carterae.2